MANGARRAGLGEVTLEFLEATSGRTGRDFFVALARSLSRATGARHAFVGEVEEAIRVRTLGYVRDGAEADDFVYELEHTPCREVTEVGMCLHPRGVAAAFPLDLMLAEMSIESYAGVPLHAGGTCVGILVAIDEAPMEDHSELGPLLALFGRSAGAEIARLRADRERAAEAARRDALTRELAASEARYRAMVTSCAEGVWLIDATGITTFVNPQMARMLGVAEGEMLGRSFFDFMDERARHDAQQNLARWRRGVSETHEFRLTHASGHDVWVLMATSPVNDESGEIVGAQAFVTDVTERRGLELKVQHAQKLESLGVLAGDIAHDFNNLLVGILGNVGLAVRESKAEAPVIPLLTDIQLAAERAADLTRQMLAYSGKGRFVVERLDLNRIVDEMSHLLSTVISKKAALRFQLAAQVPPVEADAVQLRQVVMNLITNASDAIGENPGVITLTTGVLQADAGYLSSTYLDQELTPGPYAYVEVSDTGAGMTAETQERMFDPFFTTKFTGRGLGLAAVLGILRSHRGAIKVYSEVGRGSTIKVLFPAAGGEATEVGPGRQASARPGAGLVLVCDDEESVRLVAARVLTRAGFEVIVAADGRESVLRFAERPTDFFAVLLDMTLPGLNGEEVFRELRRIRPDVRVVLSSGYNEQDATSTFVGKGLAGFLAKPWRPDELLRAVDLARD